jgi:hypothetical protein
MQWTQEQEQMLRSLWTSGMSSTAIGVKLSRTRGQILGKLDRLGLLGRGGEVHRDRSRGVRRPKLSRTLTRFV